MNSLRQSYADNRVTILIIINIVRLKKTGEKP